MFFTNYAKALNENFQLTQRENNKLEKLGWRKKFTEKLLGPYSVQDQDVFMLNDT